MHSVLRKALGFVTKLIVVEEVSWGELRVGDVIQVHDGGNNGWLGAQSNASTIIWESAHLTRNVLRSVQILTMGFCSGCYSCGVEA